MIPQDALFCPYSGQPLTPTRATVIGDGFGLLGGGRVVFPQMLGIPRLLDDALRPTLVDLIDRGQHQQAAALAIQPLGWKLSHRIERRLTRLLAGSPARHFLPALSRLGAGRRFLSHTGSFAAILRRETHSIIHDWQLHRFSARTYLPLLALAGLIGPKDKVLEIGPGMGHSTFALARRTPARNLVAVDSVFAYLYLAKRYFVPDARLICSDAEADLPVPHRHFDAVVMSDTFHFVDRQANLVAQVNRCLRPGGRVILSHIHNGHFANAYSGHARTPAEYAALFAGQNPVLADNQRLIADLCRHDRLDLTIRPPPEALNDAPHLSLVTDPQGTIAQPVTGLWSGIMAARTQLLANPLVDWSGADLSPTPVAPLVDGLLCRPDTEGVNSHPAQAADPPTTTDLLRRLVLVDAPRDYL